MLIHKSGVGLNLEFCVNNLLGNSRIWSAKGYIRGFTLQ